MVLAKDKVESKLKYKLLKTNVWFALQKISERKIDTKTKKMNNEYHGKI